MFKAVSSKVDFPSMERDVLTRWERGNILKKYLDRNSLSDKKFSFIDGPITANNPMGVHHAWGRTYKDLFQRYKTMQGFKQRYQNGFDGQGLWIEVEVEKQLGLNSKRDIEKFGIDNFVKLCKERVVKFSEIQTRQSLRLGYWMNWDDSYHTMSDENNYTIWHFLKICHNRGWLYEGRDVMPWCPRCGTGLSEHEIVTEGYKEIVHPGLYVRFPILEHEDPHVDNQTSSTSISQSLLVWTTTPWTLTSNTGASVHPERTYVKVLAKGTSPKHDDEVLIILKSRLSELRAKYQILDEIKGDTLVGLRYKGPFDELPAQQGVCRRVIAWKEVSETEGTGVVHMAPGAGKEDFAISKEEGLAVIAPLDEFGVIVEGFDWLTGKSVFEINDLIFASLRKKGLFYRLDQYSHRYPVCWRCNTELVFRLVNEWFISMKELRNLIERVTEKTRWIPEFGLRRELDWLRNMDDWMVSKKRYWGLALPIYKCECGHFEVLGGESELKARAIEGWELFEGHSPHRPWIDNVKIKCPKCGDKVSRIRDVGNPWLDAGIVPFSTIGYQTNKNHWKDWYPADLISESFPGQFRNWFYSLLTMSTVLENSEPFRTVFSYATMRAENGEEMHKSKGNAIWFEDAAEKMGADSMRWLYCRHNPANNLSFGFNVADEVRRRFIIPLWNVYSFFVTYANIDEFDPNVTAPPMQHRPELDRWIISELNSLVADVTHALDDYEPDTACRNIETFIEYLSNWYVRRTRRRFWKGGVLSHAEKADVDKLAAYATLYECLVTLSKLTAPFIPFISEEIYQNLTGSLSQKLESVHLESYPKSNESMINKQLSSATRLAMRISSLGRAARSKAGIKVRQPLKRALVKIPSQEDERLLKQVASQLRDELNIREIATMEDNTEVSHVEIGANMSVIGPKYGRKVKMLLSSLSEANPTYVINQVSLGQDINIKGFTLRPQEVKITNKDREGYSLATAGDYTVAINTEVTPELELEGIARELVHLIQSMRRSAGFEISDHIIAFYRGNQKLEQVADIHGDYIRRETLSHQLISATPDEDAYTESHSVNGIDVILGVRKK